MTKKTKRAHGIRALIAGSVFSIICLFSMCVIIVLYVAEQHGIGLAIWQRPVFRTVFLYGFCTAAATIAYYIVLHKVIKPMETLNEGTKQIAKGDFDVRLEYAGGIEELQNTIDNFNRMAEELGSVERMRKDFVASVSHEFKTPLSTMNGYATLLQDPDLTADERRELSKKLLFHINRFNDLAENVLRLSKLENQQYMEAPVRFALDEQIREAVVMLESKWAERDMELDIELPEMYYTGQKQLLFQVWMNLIGNAIKFTEPGGKIAICLEKKEREVEVRVSDNGIGMSRETMAHVFDKFYQGDTSRRAQGNGLGLAICKEIVERCGGAIEIESEEGVGTTFTVHLQTK